MEKTGLAMGTCPGGSSYVREGSSEEIGVVELNRLKPVRARCLLPMIPALEAYTSRLKSEGSLGCTVKARPSWAMQLDPMSAK